MTDNELRKLKRTELLELLLTQEKENEDLRQQIRTLQGQLADRKILLGEAGNIADASLRLNGVFEAAQTAADEYLTSIRHMSERQEARCTCLEAEAQERADRLMQETEARCAAMQAKAQKESQAYWEVLCDRMQQFCDACPGLRELLVDHMKGNTSE